MWTRNLSHLIGNHGWQSCSNRQAVEPRCSFRDQRSSSVAARRWSVSLAQPHFQSQSHHKHRSDDSLRAVGRVTRGRFPCRCACAENTAFLFGWCKPSLHDLQAVGFWGALWRIWVLGLCVQMCQSLVCLCQSRDLVRSLCVEVGQAPLRDVDERLALIEVRSSDLAFIKSAYNACTLEP